MMSWHKSRKSFQVIPLEMDRDYLAIDQLFNSEEWPFIRADLEASHSQPRSTALVARSDQELLGFFATHHFDDIGYLDMMIVCPNARSSHVARKLYFETTRQMKKKGMKSWVGHSTNDSYRMFKFMRFQPGQSFTLLAREPLSTAAETESLATHQLSCGDLDALVALDQEVFGTSRIDWITTLLGQPTTRFFGLRQEGELVASLCTRTRKQNAICLDCINGQSMETLIPLLDRILSGMSSRRLECFARTDSALHHYLLQNGFTVPDFFAPIGPLVEWRKGPTGNVGLSSKVLSLAWF